MRHLVNKGSHAIFPISALPHHVLLGPSTVIKAGKDGRIEDARCDPTGFRQPLKAFRHELKVVAIRKGAGGQLHREPEFVQPFRDPAVDGNLEPAQAQPLQQVPRLLMAEALVMFVNEPGCIPLGLRAWL